MKLLARFSPALALFLGCCGLRQSESPPQEEVTAKIEESRIVVQVGDEPFAEIHFSAEPRPFVYPLFAPGGVAVTRGYPLDPKPDEAHDHPHHQSLWFAHGSVNGSDFWSGQDAVMRLSGDPIVESKKDGVTCTTHYLWQAKEQTVLKEERTIRFALEGDARVVDFTTRLTATEKEVRFGDTKEGSFAIRTHPQLRLSGPVANGKAINRAGDKGESVWGKRAGWIVYHGPIDGKKVGIAMFDHPENLRHPTWWHARKYGLVAANPFGIHDFEKKPAGSGEHLLPAGESLTLNYRVVLFAGPFSRAHIEDAYSRYTAR